MIHRARIYRGPAKNTPTARNSKSSSLGMNKCWRSVFDNFFPLFHGLTVDSALLQPWLRLFLGAIGDLVKCCWMVVILSQKLLLCCTCKPDVTLGLYKHATTQTLNLTMNALPCSRPSHCRSAANTVHCPLFLAFTGGGTLRIEAGCLLLCT